MSFTAYIKKLIVKDKNFPEAREKLEEIINNYKLTFAQFMDIYNILTNLKYEFN